MSSVKLPLLNGKADYLKSLRHRAATTGNDAIVKLLINPPPQPDGNPRATTRLNTGDRIGNTPLHLAIESAHASTAVTLIEAGADRERVSKMPTKQTSTNKVKAKYGSTSARRD